MSSAKKTNRPEQTDELSALIQIRQGGVKEDTTGKIDRVALERAEKTARTVQRIETRARKRPPFALIALVLVLATVLGWFAAQSGWL